MNQSDFSLRNPKVLILVAVCLLVGIFGGLIGIFIVNDYFSLVGRRSRQVVLQENSAIIEVAKKLEPSVVSITTETQAVDVFGRVQQQNGAGTGIIIRSDGLILTNKHVIPSGSDNVVVTLNDGKQFEGAKVLARDPQLDLAYVKVDASNLEAAELGDSDKVVVGQKVIAVGNALGEFQNTVTAGIISGLGRPVAAGDASESELLQDLFQTDAAINPGNSGGPLVNIEGQVIGINTAVAEAENIGFAIPINQAKAGIASIEGAGELSKPYLGVRYVPLNKDIAKANNLASEQGAWVRADSDAPAVLPESPAAKAGLKEGDIITKIDDKAIGEDGSLSTLIGQKKVGDKVTVTYLRDGKQQNADITLEELQS